MKTLTTLLAALTIMAGNIFAQTENPRGLYKLQRLGYENGRPDQVPEIEQYKYFSDYVPLTLLIMRDTPEEYAYYLKQDEPTPYNFTGDVPVGEDGRGTRIYDSNSERVTVKWYNNIRANDYGLFPQNEFITEYYEAKDFEPRMRKSIEMLENKNKKPDHRVAGCWRLLGQYETIEGERALTRPQGNIYRIYGETDVVFLFCIGNRIMGANVICRPVEYKSDVQINEGDNVTTIITWRNDNSFILKRANDDGSVTEELWKRTGLPQTFQKLFGTDVPIAE